MRGVMKRGAWGGVKEEEQSRRAGPGEEQQEKEKGHDGLKTRRHEDVKTDTGRTT